MRHLNSKYWPYHTISVYNAEVYKEKCLWLEQNIGRYRLDWHVILSPSTGEHHYFQREQDYMLYLLRWS